MREGARLAGMPPVALLFILGVIAIAVVLTWQRVADERKWTERYLEGFGAPIERTRDLERAAAWFRGREGANAATGAIDERTWRDLDMDAVWATLDRTASQVGAQILYDRLRRPAVDTAEPASFEAAVERLEGDAALRMRVTRDLLRLKDWHVSFLPDLLWGALPSPLPMRALFVADALLVVVLFLVMPWWPRALLVVLALFVTNYLVKLALRPRIDPFVPSLRALPILAVVVERLRRVDDPALAPYLEVLRHHAGSLRLLKRASRWVAFESGSDNAALGAMAELARSFQEYFNIAFLLDLNAFNFAIERIRANQAALRAVVESVGTLDAAIAVASVRHGWAGTWCRPQETGDIRQLHAETLRHPLLPDAVANDFQADGKSWLVTGSNMSGKSTFLRTVGVNAVLARTIHTVRATRWEGNAFAVRSCIGRSDSLLEGKSYYLAEVEGVRDLILASQGGAPTLFILDELFRGTNTIERIAAARAVLEALDVAPHLVLVATHDIELLRWLGARYEAWHFREQVADGELLFDYRLRRGPSSTRNAVALLRLKGYPESVVQQAEATVDEQEGNRQQQRAPGRE